MKEKRKIRMLDEATIHLADGYVTIHIAEQLDGSYNMTISEHNDHILRIGFPVEGGTHYRYWSEVKKAPGTE